MALTTAELNVLLDKVGTDSGFLALHSADPGGTGASETTATRQAATWASAASGSKSLTGTYSFTGGAANGACTFVGLWSASTAGTFRGGFALTGDQTFNAAGAYTLDSLTLSAT